MKYVIFSLFFVFSLSTWADTSLETPTGETVQMKLESLPTQRNDSQTQSLLTNIIKKSEWFPELKVKVNHGLVEFTGVVNKEKQINWLINIAERLPSVIAVINKTELKTSPLMGLTSITEEFRQWLERGRKHLPAIVVSLLMLVAFYFASSLLYKLSRNFWGRHIENIFLVATMTKLSMVPVFFFMFYMLLLTLGLEGLAVTIIGGTGVMGLVLGLAFKSIAENFLSGILLAIRSPFVKGDMIKVGDTITGVVQNLNMRGTTLMDLDGTMILIPNTTVVQSIVQNISTNPLTRTCFDIGIGFDDSIVKAQDILMKVLLNSDQVEKDPPPLALVQLLGVSSVTIRVYFWLNIKTVNLIAIRSQVIGACKAALMTAGISMPDDNREVIFKAPLQVSMLNESTPHPTAPIKPMAPTDDIHAHNLEESMPSKSPEEIAKRLGQVVELPGNTAGSDLLGPSRN